MERGFGTSLRGRATNLEKSMDARHRISESQGTNKSARHTHRETPSAVYSAPCFRIIWLFVSVFNPLNTSFLVVGVVTGVNTALLAIVTAIAIAIAIALTLDTVFVTFVYYTGRRLAQVWSTCTLYDSLLQLSRVLQLDHNWITIAEA